MRLRRLRAIFKLVRPSCGDVNGEHIGYSPRPQRLGEDVGNRVKPLISLNFGAKHVSRSLAKNAAATGYVQYSTHPRGCELVTSKRKPLYYLTGICGDPSPLLLFSDKEPFNFPRREVAP